MPQVPQRPTSAIAPTPLPTSRLNPGFDLGIALSAIERLNSDYRVRLFGRGERIDLERPETVGKEIVIPFRCDLIQAAIIVDTIRAVAAKVGDPVPAAYIREDETWRPLPSIPLTLPDGRGGWILNPAAFPNGKDLVRIASPVKGPVVLGRRN